MTQKIYALFIVCILISGALFAQSGKNFYDFTVKSIDGDDFNFKTLKGKKVMVVNTASKCGLTPQYKQLQAIYEQYGSEDFIIIGFPANNFLSQEPGSNQEIKTFCTTNYGVTFPMMQKISVKGENMHPVYQWLTQKTKNGFSNSKVKWNFQKYLIDNNGKLSMVISPRVKPNAPEIINWITQE
ncbi:glutathione peroxidase [Marinilabiliaceae bacterium JC017]|nr:glutathione peroxidase [Marinilabiliaceae bacterium JC017]